MLIYAQNVFNNWFMNFPLKQYYEEKLYTLNSKFTLIARISVALKIGVSGTTNSTLNALIRKGGA